MAHHYASHELSALGSLFPAGAAVVCLPELSRYDALHPSEARQIAGASQLRIQDFSAGRHCARRALAHLGFSNYPLMINEDRTPNWPSGVVGSISHTEGFAAAVVAQDKTCRSVGIDVEKLGRITQDLWSQICSEKEMNWLAAIREPEAAALAASVIFSAKEGLL